MGGLATLQGVGNKLWAVVTRIPGVIWLVLGAVLLLQLYIHQREADAVARAEVQHWRDSVEAVTAARQAAADSLLQRWQDSVTALHAALAEDTMRAQAARMRGSIAEGALAGVLHQAHLEADTNTKLHLALTQIEVQVQALQDAHAAEVGAWRSALAVAAQIHATDSAAVDSLRIQLAAANRSIAATLAKLDQVRRGPSLGHRLVREIPVALGGYAAGRIVQWP